jgi:hypothetical protein
MKMRIRIQLHAIGPRARSPGSFYENHNKKDMYRRIQHNFLHMFHNNISERILKFFHGLDPGPGSALRFLPGSGSEKKQKKQCGSEVKCGFFHHKNIIPPNPDIRQKFRNRKV